MCGKPLQKCIFRRTVRSSKSLRPLRALQTRTTTERKKSKNFKRGCDFFTHEKRRFFFDFGRRWSVFLFHRSKKKKKKICQRERETWQQKKERDFRFSLKRHTQIKHAPSQITTGVLSSLRFSTTLFCDTTFRFRDTKRQKKQRRVSFCSFFSRRGLHVFLVAS